MRAMRLSRHAPVGEAPLELVELDVPRPGPGELLVRLRACAVCRTDLHVVEGDLPFVRLPIVPGHMAVGTVEERGPEPEGGWPADAPAAGHRVGIAWLRGTCGTCAWCTSGRENLCREKVFTGAHVDGGYAEWAVVPAAWAHELPAAMDDEHAAPLLCAGIIGYRALELAGVPPGGTLGLVGFGNSAHVVAQLARHRGLRLFVASRGGLHRELATELGAELVTEAGDLPAGGLDGAILFAPAGELVPPTLRALAPGATLACAGIHMTPIPAIDYDRELFDERCLRSVTANTRADARALLREAAEVPVRTEVQVYELSEANRALADLAADRVRGSALLRIR